MLLLSFFILFIGLKTSVLSQKNIILKRRKKFFIFFKKPLKNSCVFLFYLV